MCNGLPRVERVLNLLPQLHVTATSLYAGWMSAFICFLSSVIGAAREYARMRARIIHERQFQCNRFDNFIFSRAPRHSVA